MTRTMQQGTLDHVAIHVGDRSAVADELVDRFDMHVIERTDRFTLIGASADHGKITLLDADDGAAPTPDRIVSLVLAEASGSTPVPVALNDGLMVTFVNLDELGPEWSGTPRHALIGVTLRANDPPLAAAELEGLHGMHVEAMSPDVAVLDVGGSARDGRITLSRERWVSGEQPAMLDHIGIRVPDAAAWRDRAEQSPAAVVRWVEAPHSRAVFVAGPDDLLIEFVELTSPLEA